MLPAKQCKSLIIREIAATIILMAAAFHSSELFASTTPPADIIGAAYFDRNADGTVDVVRISFNKPVNPKNIFVQLTWQGRKQSGPDFNDTTINLLSTSTIEIALHEELFGYDDLFIKQTSGRMEVRVKDIDFIKDVRNGLVMDSAAPVLIKLEYSQGRNKNTPQQFYADTINAEFSESLKEPPRSTTPFMFADTAGENIIAPVVSSAFRSFKGYRCIVDVPNRYSTVVRINGYVPKDTAWINVNVDPAAQVCDSFGNCQNNALNRGVPVTVLYRPVIVPDTTSTKPKEINLYCGCGTGTGLAFIPPLFFYSRNRWRRRAKDKARE